MRNAAASGGAVDAAGDGVRRQRACDGVLPARRHVVARDEACGSVPPDARSRGAGSRARLARSDRRQAPPCEEPWRAPATLGRFGSRLPGALHGRAATPDRRGASRGGLTRGICSRVERVRALASASERPIRLETPEKNFFNEAA